MHDFTALNAIVTKLTADTGAILIATKTANNQAAYRRCDRRAHHARRHGDLRLPTYADCAVTQASGQSDIRSRNRSKNGIAVANTSPLPEAKAWTSGNAIPEA